MRLKMARAVGPLVLALACAPGAALAQSPSPIVPRDRPDQTPVQPPVSAQEAPATTQAPAALQQITPFQLQRVEVSGSTLPAEALEANWRPLLGQTVGSTEVAGVTDAIIAAYERSDIALYTVLVPTQDFAGGVLRIRVLEGYVESVAVQGAGERERILVQRYLDQLKAERPLTRTTLQRYISLTRDLPGMRSDISFVTGAETGAVGVVAKVDALPVQFAMSANNRGAAFLGRTQVGADLFLNNLVLGGQTRLSLVVPTDIERFQYVGLSHSQLLGVSGASVQASLGYLRTRPRESDLEGEAISAGVQFTYPLLRSYNRDLYVTAGIDGLDANSVLVGSTFSDDRTRAGRLSVVYAQQAARSRFSLSGAASLGLDILGASTLSPEVTELNYFKLNGRAVYAQEVADRLFLRLAAAGQWTDDRLPASEQFGLGGNEFGRAFEAAALTGDDGYAASAEIAYRPARLPDLIQDGEAYGFVDGGETFYMRRPFTAELDEGLASIGIGVRGTFRRRLAVQLEATRPLGASLSSLENRGSRLIFSVRSVW